MEALLTGQQFWWTSWGAARACWAGHTDTPQWWPRAGSHWTSAETGPSWPWSSWSAASPECGTPAPAEIVISCRHIIHWGNTAMNRNTITQCLVQYCKITIIYKFTIFMLPFELKCIIFLPRIFVYNVCFLSCTKTSLWRKKASPKKQ